MEEIALTALPRSLDSEASSEAASDTDSDINSTAPSPRVSENLKRHVIFEPAVPTLYKPLEMYPSLENQPDPGIYPAALKLPSRIIKFHLDFPSSMEHHGKVIELSLNLAGNHNNDPIIDALRKAYGLTARHSMDLKNRAGYRILLDESIYEDGMEVFVSVVEHEEEESNVYNRMEPMLHASTILSDDLYSLINTGNNDTHSHEDLFHSERSKQPQNNADPPTSGSFSLPAISTDSTERLHEQGTEIGRPQQSSREAGTGLELHFHTEAPDALKIMVEQQDGPPFDSDDNLLELEAYENPPSRYARQYSIISPDEEMHGKAVALYDFARENDHELPLVKGQVILVSYRHGQGWLVAQNPKSGESGLVPEVLVRLLPKEHLNKTENSKREDQFPPKKHDKCPRCDMEFMYYTYLRHHLSTIHGEETAYDCWACQAGFSRFMDLKSHIEGRHKNDLEGLISQIIPANHGIDTTSAAFTTFKMIHLFNTAAEYCADRPKAEYTDGKLRENIIERFGKWDRDQIEGSKGPPPVPNSPFEHADSQSQYEPRLETQLLDDTGEGIVVPTSQKRQQQRLRGYPCTHGDCDKVFDRFSDRT
jgi:hypothetical protein